MTFINSITIYPQNITVKKGKWYYGAYAEICPTDATCQCVTWRSSNSNIASVNQNGYICGVSKGSAVIYATAQDGSGAVGFCNVTVVAPIKVSSVTVTPSTKTVNGGDTFTLSATVLPNNADEKRIRWTSNDCNIADVDYITGMVTAKSAGTTYIYANAIDGSGVSGYCELTVSAPIVEDTVLGLETIKQCRIRKDMSMDDSAILKNSDGTSVLLNVGDTVPLLSATNDSEWYRILYNGMMLYVTNDGSFEEITLSPPAEPTGRTVEVFVDNANALNIRSAPYMEDRTLMKVLSNGTFVTLTNETPQNGEWYAVYGQANDGTYSYGWCLGEYLGNHVEYGTLVDVDSLTVRSGAGTGHTSLGTISKGDTVEILEKNCATASGYTWHKIRYNDTEGYVVAGNNTPNFTFETRWVVLASNTTPDNSIEAILNNLENCSSSVIPTSKKEMCVAIARAMFEEGYKPAFVAGMLSNLKSEGDIGFFESSNYTSHPEEKPDYLVYMDTNYNGTNFYKINYSGKTIMDVNVINVYNMLSWLKNNSDHSQGDWRIGSSRVGFGLGSLQWTFSRSFDLIQRYIQANNNSANITKSQAIQAEIALIIDELKQSLYKNIVTEWENNSYNNLASASAANEAASLLCLNYLKPAEKITQASIRGKNAEIIYEEMMK